MELPRLQQQQYQIRPPPTQPIRQHTRDICRRLEGNDKNLSVIYSSSIGHRFNRTEELLFTRALNKNKRVVLLDLSHQVLSARGQDSSFKELTETVLRRHPCLYTLMLVSCCIGEVAAAWLSEALRSKKCRLTSLSIHYNYLGDLGAKALAQGLMENNRLQYISLSENKITDAGCRSIAQMLRVNRGLVRVDLSGNPAITDAGANEIIDALRTSNYTLEAFLFGGNDRVSSGKVQRLRELCESNRRVKSKFAELSRQQSAIPRSVWPDALAAIGEKPDIIYQMINRNHEVFFY